MYEYYWSDELARLTIILGIAVSTIIYKRTGLTLGGVIACGYLALFMGQPLHIVVTLAIALLTYALVHGALKKRFMLNGSRLFEIEILIGLILQVTWLMAIRVLHRGFYIDLALLYGIGFVLPGVIAHDMGRQGPRSTLWSLLLGVAIVILILIPLQAVEQVVLPLLRAGGPSYLHSQPGRYAFPLSLLPFAVVASVLIDLLLHAWLRARSGGFVSAAYLALFAWLPLHLVFVVASSLLTFGFVRWMSRHTVLAFGRTKLGFMVLAGVVITWLAELLIIDLTHGQFIPWSGFVVIMPMIVSLLANEYDRQGLWRTTMTTGLSTVSVLAVMTGLVYLIHLAHLDWLLITT
jgi:poly-gamma-glutamate biosynthesis protein PgsC/CapC